MTSMTGVPQTATLTALCCACGEVRTVSKRATGSERPLRCTACNATTRHAVIGAYRDDFREEMNSKKTPKLSAADKLDVLESLGVRVEYRDTLGGTDSRRAIVQLWWWFDNDDFLVLVSRDSTDAERAGRLTEALEYVTEPHRKSWFIDTRNDDPVANVSLNVNRDR